MFICAVNRIEALKYMEHRRENIPALYNTHRLHELPIPQTSLETNIIVSERQANRVVDVSMDTNKENRSENFNAHAAANAVESNIDEQLHDERLVEHGVEQSDFNADSNASSNDLQENISGNNVTKNRTEISDASISSLPSCSSHVPSVTLTTHELASENRSTIGLKSTKNVKKGRLSKRSISVDSYLDSYHTYEFSNSNEGEINMLIRQSPPHQIMIDTECIMTFDRFPMPMKADFHGLIKHENDDLSGNKSYFKTVISFSPEFH